MTQASMYMYDGTRGVMTKLRDTTRGTGLEDYICLGWNDPGVPFAGEHV